ncbi:hypothetical protein Zmor_027547 [Zophobas morio]|uniref:CRAL/TRIO N-terminal domain-containing protein n=1 Tax=Zophobas morio TaxID=2755281 RepID=A0AA38M233_9CUCU|nr:hypothetical protein Zmor_027547 [Zophobas morio]
MFYLEQPSPDQQVLIRQALNEDVNTRDKDLEAIKEWLRKEPHLPDTWDDAMLMTFLRSCNFSLEKTKRRLDKYFTVKTIVPEFFTECDIARPEMQTIVNALEIATMPGMTPEGRRVHIARIATSDFEDFDYNYFARVIFMVADVYLKSEKLGSAGEVYVLDGENYRLKHLLKLLPIFAKNFSEFLPEAYGGTAGKLKLHWDKYLAAFEDFKPWFKEQENIKADESKRPGKTTSYEDCFGLHGSFRSLAVD